jgi:hypothetical protein
VTKSQQNINNNNTIKYRRNTIILNECQQGYRYLDPPNSFADHRSRNRIQLVGLKTKKK